MLLLGFFLVVDDSFLLCVVLCLLKMMMFFDVDARRIALLDGKIRGEYSCIVNLIIIQ